MKSIFTIVFFYLFAVLITGCASSPKMGNVIPTEGGIYQVITTGDSKNTVLKSALFSAETACKDRHMRHIVLDQKIEYQGLVTEGTNQIMNKAQEIIAITTGGILPTFSSDDDYRMTMQFKCEK